ncbi:ABC transporter ATP-binding protein [uncultured Mycobacterium sp.]|uniref:ABC transporter ATP-binding protein n=1 Tax=uncultured Mycobacterium sp. TaxID=171292 RepID=UPI0035C9685A
MVVAVCFEAFCLINLCRAEAVRYLPKWAWTVICVISIPLGGIVYLSIGKTRDHAAHEPRPPQGAPHRSHPAPVAALAGLADAIEVKGLTKRFGSLTALDDLSFTVQPGRVTGFLGPNGAGKSTTMRVILGLDAPTSGSALIGGRVYGQIVRPLRQVGSLLDANAMHPGRSGWQHLRSVAQSNGISKRRVREVLDLTGVETVAQRPVGSFSLGMKQRLGIALALLGDPPILICDEPVNGLDPEGVHWIRELFKTLAAEGRTVFVSSHLMSEMALTADHLVIIGRGRLLADTSVERFIESNARSDVLVRSPQIAALTTLLTSHGATVTADGDHGLAVTGLDAPTIADLAAEHTIPVHELTPRHATLEQAYLDLTEASVDYPAGASTGKETVPS